MSGSHSKKQQVQTTKNSNALAKASSIDLSKSLNALAQFGVSSQSTLAKIQEEMIQKFAELQAVDDAIALKKQEMEALHGSDSLLLTIDDLRVQHAKTLENQHLEREELVKAFNTRRTELEIERDREAEQHNYKLVQLRKADADTWTENVRLRGIAEKERQEAFEKDIKNRSAELTAKETEYAQALNKAASFDADVQKEVSKQVSIITNAMKKDHEHANQLVAIQHKSANDQLTADNVRLSHQLETEKKVTEQLQIQLKASFESQAQLAKDAVAGANNKQAQADALALVTNIGQGGNGTRPRS